MYQVCISRIRADTVEKRIHFESSYPCLAILEALFEHTGAGTLLLDWQSTPRNGPTRETLAVLFGEVPEVGVLSLTRDDFNLRSPRRYAAIHLAP